MPKKGFPNLHEKASPILYIKANVVSICVFVTDIRGLRPGQQGPGEGLFIWRQDGGAE